MAEGFTKLASAVAHAVGRPLTFVVCCLAVLVWGASGPLFGFSDTWQLIINTSTTIITFLMVFIIQNTQNRDGAAIQAKLDELIEASEGRNSVIGIEWLAEDEIDAIRNKIEARAKAAGDEEDVEQVRAKREQTKAASRGKTGRSGKSAGRRQTGRKRG